MPKCTYCENEIHLEEFFEKFKNKLMPNKMINAELVEIKRG